MYNPADARPASMPTVAEFGAWLDGAEPGAAIVYHRGFLACDRDGDVPHAKQAVERARFALAWAEAGWILLVQRRIGWAEYEYLAIKRARRTKG